jgi:CTLH/CRA C-terminal to LisH motif domain
MQPAFLEEIEKTVALLAFEDVKNSPYGELLDTSQRMKTASAVNAAILTSQSHEKGILVICSSLYQLRFVHLALVFHRRFHLRI